MPTNAIGRDNQQEVLRPRGIEEGLQGGTCCGCVALFWPISKPVVLPARYSGNDERFVPKTLGVIEKTSFEQAKNLDSSTQNDQESYFGDEKTSFDCLFNM